MRILYLSQYFPPEVGATQARAHEMAKRLVENGHRVMMICEIPNHPSGIIPSEYKGRLYERTDLDGIEVIRVWVKVSPVKTLYTRLAFYLSYMITATVAGLFLTRRCFDIIYATSPPLFVGTAGLALSTLLRTPLIFEVRDLWPESAVALGELKNKWAIVLAQRIERACYNRARRIVVVTGGIRDHLIKQGFSGEKLILIPNGANTDLFHPNPEAGATLRADLGIGDAFLIIYAGIHGIAQGLETVVEAANLLRDDSRIQFLFVGEGPVKPRIIAMSEQHGLKNILFHREVPREQMPAFLSAADAALVPLRKIELFKGALPLKMFEAWAAGCPTIVGIEGEARQVLEMADAGRFVEPENPVALAEAIKSLAADRAECRAMGERGRSFVAVHYSRQNQARQLEQLLLKVTRGE